jgi:RNA polymerase sigma-70 factor (ECF subfamily)
MTEMVLASQLQDGVLIKLVLAGRADCFTILMDRHLATLRKRIGKLARDAGEAEDLLQEVLLKVWIHLSTFRLESSFQTWMTRIAINEALQLFRRE